MRDLSTVALSGTAAVVLLLTGTLASCSAAGEGVRLEGPPTASPAPDRAKAPPDAATARTGEEQSAASPAPEFSDGGVSDGFRPPRLVPLLRDDPKVGDRVKRELAPCGGRFPITFETGRATGLGESMVVNVFSCETKTAVGAYVYRQSSSGTWVNVFTGERGVGHATLEEGELVLVEDVYLGEGRRPMGSEVRTYRWRDGVFRMVDHKRVYADGFVQDVTSSPSPAPGADTPRADAPEAD